VALKSLSRNSLDMLQDLNGKDVPEMVHNPKGAWVRYDEVMEALKDFDEQVLKAMRTSNNDSEVTDG
jgi:hypothetical protein